MTPRFSILSSSVFLRRVLDGWLILLLALVSPAYSQTTNFWRTQSIYQVITDRFYNGNTTNDNLEGTFNPYNNEAVHGGDFQGVEQKLDYIKALGATAIWISPIILNTEGQFHGYSGMDFYQVAPHWGTVSNLQHLVQSAHARGLLVIDDIVVNHAGDLVKGTGSGYPAFNYPTGYTLSYVSSGKTYPTPFNLTSTNAALTNLFHNYGNIADYNNTNQVLNGWLSGLNDFRTETPYIQSQMAAIYQSWIGKIGFDGFRIDTALEVDMGFWNSFCPAIHAYARTNGNTNFFMFGEAYNSSESLVGSYTGTENGGQFKFDSVLDYPLFFDITSVFAVGTGNTAQIEAHYAAVDSEYDPAARMQLVTFLDNHDNPRFLSAGAASNNYSRLELALSFLYTARGVPCLYYGTEQGFNGATDPYDREDMFAGQFKDGTNGVDSFNETHPLFLWVATLNNFRRLYPALTLGSHVNQWNTPNSPGLFAYSRVWNSQEIFVVLNTAITNQTLPARYLTYPGGTIMQNLLNTNETFVLDADSSTPALPVPGLTPKLFIAKSLYLPVDPVVISNFPPHDSTNVATTTPIVLAFNYGMDTNSVQNAFSTTPSVAGTFSWSSNQTVMTFNPAGAGFAPLTNIVITLTNSAFNAGLQKPLYAPYNFSFHSSNTPPLVTISSPASDGDVVAVSSNTTYLIQICFTPTLDTNDPTLFTLSINGILQPRSAYVFRPPGATAGCSGLRSLLYNWSGSSTGSNVIQIVYSNNGGMLSDSRTVIVPPPLAISALTNNQQTVVWSSTPGVNYVVLATTNLTQPFIPISGTVAATGLTTSYQDISNSPPVPQKFYEIEVVP